MGRSGTVTSTAICADSFLSVRCADLGGQERGVVNVCRGFTTFGGKCMPVPR